MQVDKNKEDSFSRKTKSYHKPNKSDNNKSSTDKREQMMVFLVNHSKQGRSQRNCSDKCSSDFQYKHQEERVNTNREMDGKTEINKDITNNKNKELEQQLQHEELIRQGLAKSNDKKIKISSRKRQVISHDILHPPINTSVKFQKKDVKQPNQSQRIEQQQYEQIADNVRLDNLHSKVVQTPCPKKEETFLAKIHQSQSEVISSPLNNQKLVINQSPQKHQQAQYLKKSEPFVNMLKIEQGINESTFRQRQMEEQQKLTQKRSNRVQQTKTTMPKQNKLELVTATVEQKLLIMPNQEEEDNRKLHVQISMLKQAVRELKLQKIKARAEYSNNIDNAPLQQQKKSRYQTINSSVDEKEQVTGSKYGKIRKNRSLSRKKVYSLKSNNELSLQRQLQLPHPIINVKKLPQKIQFDAFLSQRKPVEESGRQYRTMDLGRIAEQNMQESFKFQTNLATSIDMPLYGSKLRSNKISMRGPQICNQVLNKFQNSQRNFRDFVQLSSKNKTQNSRVQEVMSRGSESSNDVSFGGTIVKNNYLSKPSSHTNRVIDLKSISLIRQGQKIVLRKSNRDFKITSIPQVPNSPLYSTPTEEMMELILKVLPYTNLEYSSKDLQDCILKKFKNSIMFELKRFPLTKVVWYFNGKLYIGEWDDKKNEKTGFGKQFSKGKSYYQGTFKDNKRNGKGSFVTQGYLYQGEWVNGERKGYGKYLQLTDHLYYQGLWTKGKKDGKGHCEFQGNIYEGIFQNDVKMGFGIELFKNGDRYIGSYENGKFQGQGKYMWFNGSFYLGHFRQGFREGLGKWQSGIDNYQLYVGEFHRDKKQGNGKYVWSNRCVYEGNFFNDLKHGLGSILYPDGRYVQGIWTQGILTEILSKVSQANKQQPLDEPRHRTLQSRTIIRVVER